MNVTLSAAFLAGLATFLSPCILPLIPSYIFYMTGLSAKRERSSAEDRAKALLHALTFVLGFSVIFVLLGVSVFFLSKKLLAHQDILRVAAGSLIVIFGIHLSGIIRIPFLYKDKHINISRKKSGVGMSFLMGAAFSFAWTPCAGPILGSILALASTQQTVNQGIFLLILYSAGLGVPFILTAVLIDKFVEHSKLINRFARHISLVSGIILVLVGIAVIFDLFNNLRII